MSLDIGGRLRFVRARHKLSQRELAKRSGVTNSTISLIESNQMNPSVGALKRILDGLPMGSLILRARAARPARRSIGDELTGSARSDLLPPIGDPVRTEPAESQARYEPGIDTAVCR